MTTQAWKIDNSHPDGHERAILPDGRVGYLKCDPDGVERVYATIEVGHAEDHRADADVYAVRHAPQSLHMLPGLEGGSISRPSPYRLRYKDQIAGPPVEI